MALKTPYVYLTSTIATNFNTSNITITGQLSQQQVIETLNLKSSTTGTVTHDFTTGAIWYHSTMLANFTVALTNVPTTPNRATVVSLVLNQGAAPYYANGLSVNGAAVPIRWPNAVAPTAQANRTEIESFTLYYIGTSWSAVGQYTSFGTV
jgi:hypothetical protein